jgi:hypothetical protein
MTLVWRDDMAGQTYKTSDPEVIKRWATMRAGRPALMPSHEQKATTAVVPGIIFSTNSSLNSYPTISWRELFARMQQEGLVFVYQEKTVSGSLSHFCRFVSQEAAREVETGPAPPAAPPSEATGLYQTDALDTPLAQGTQAFRAPHRTTKRSWRLLVGVAVLVMIIVFLIIGVFWPVV